MPTRLAVGLGPKRLPYAGFPVIRPLKLGPPFPSTRTGFGRPGRESICNRGPVVIAKHIYHFGKKANRYLSAASGGEELLQRSEFDPAIVGLAFFGIVGVDGPALAVATSGHPGCGDPFVQQEFQHCLGPALGQIDVMDG